MSEPIKIVLTAETAEAAAKLKAFCESNAIAFKSLAKVGHEAEGMFAANKMAIMELEHSARSLADGLVAGINPMRMLAMEGPRLLQSGSLMTEEFKTKLMGFLPILGGVGVAIAAGAVAWHYYGDALVDPTKRARELADALQKVPDALKQIQTAERAGSITAAQAQKYRDMLPGGAMKLYNQETIADAFGGHAARIGNGAGGILGEDFPQLTTDRYIRNSRTGKIIGERQEANAADRELYARQQRRGVVTDANDQSKPGDVAAAALRVDEMKWTQQSSLGLEKQEERIRRQADEMKNKLEEEHATARTAKGWTADDEVKYQAQIKAVDADADKAINELKQRAATEAATKAAEAQKKIQEAAAKDGAEQIKALEKQITANQDQEGHLRGQFAVAEYVQRAALLVKLLAEGDISQAEYSDKMEDAQHKANEGIKEYRAELERVAALEQEIARSKIEAKIKGIEGDDSLTSQQKTAALIPLYQQLQADNEARINKLQSLSNSATDDATRLEVEKQINELLNQNADLAIKIKEAEKTTSFTANLSADFASFASKVSNLAADMAHFAMAPFEGMRQGLASALDTLLEKGSSAKQFFGTIALSIGRSMIQAFSDMVANWIMSHVVMAGVSAAWHALTTGQQAVATTAQVGIHTAGEAAKTGATAAGAGSRAGIGWLEVAWHGLQTGMKVAMHFAGELAMTAWTLIQSAIRHAIVFLELQPYIILAGIEAAAAVAGIPIVGPILAPIAAAVTIAGLEGLAAFEAGGRPTPGNLALVGEAGPELFIPDPAGTIIPADQTARMLNATPRPLAGSGAATGPGATPGGNKVSVYSFVDKTEMQHHLEQNDDHEKWVVGVMGKNAHKFA